MTVTSLKYIKFLPLSAAILLLPTLGFADDYVIDYAATSQNGGATLADGDSITVTADGSVTRTGAGNFGLYTDQDNGTLINRGTITTTGEFAFGIYHWGDYGTLSNSGTITTTGRSAYGIYHLGDYGTVINSGTITTEGDYARGILYNGDYGTVINSGTITTEGNYAYALFDLGDYGTLINSGTIETTGSDAHALYHHGNNGTVINSGTITTTGNYAYALYHHGNNGTVINSGTITTEGIWAYALYHSGDNGTLINSGTITTTGDYARGIRYYGDYGTVTNSGTVLATGTGSYAVYMGGTGATLNLNAGSILQGDEYDIYFSDTSTATLNFGPGLNMVVTSDSSDLDLLTITAPNSAYVVVDSDNDGADDTIYSVDITGFAAADVAAAAANSLVLDALSGRSAFPVQVTRGAIGAGRTWAQVFAGGLSAQSTSLTSAYDAYTGGFVLGREQADGNGFFGGLSLGRTVGTAFSTDRTGAFVGFYRGLDIGAAGSEYSVTVGVNANKAEREISASGSIETAAASYTSFSLGAAATFEGALGVDNSSARLRYLGIYTSGYSESGSSADLIVAGRMTHVAEVRLQMKSAGWGPGTLRYGVDGQYISAGATETILAGSDLSFENAHGGFAGRGFVGYDFDTALANGITATGSLELGLGNTGTASAQASFRILF